MSVTALDPTDPSLQQLRAQDPDSYFSTLFAPAAARAGLQALYAFRVEIASVRDKISQPLPGEVRLQWWSDVIQGKPYGGATGHPLALCLNETIERYKLPRSAFVDLIESSTFDLYDDPMPHIRDLEGYAGETHGAIRRLACLVLADGGEIGSADACGHAGVALAVGSVLETLALHRARGQLYLPVEILGRHGLDRDGWLGSDNRRARDAAVVDLVAIGERHLSAFNGLAKGLPAAVRPAFLPTASLPMIFAACRKAGAQASERPIRIATWRRLLAMWRLSRRL